MSPGADLTSERYRDLLEDMNAIVWEADPETGQFTYVSPGAQLVLGYGADEWFEDPEFLTTHIHPDDRDEVMTHWAEEIAAGRDHVTEYRMLDAEGRQVWVRNSVRRIRDAAGHTLLFRGVMWDITIHKRSEEALRDSQKRYRYLVDHANDIIYKTDVHGNFTFFNDAAPKIMQMRPADLLGRNYIDMVRPDYRPALKRFYLRQFARQVLSSYFEFPVLTGGGGYRWLGQNVQLVMERDGVVGFQGIARDLTEQKEAEARLLESEERYRIVAETATDAIITFDAAAEIIFANSSTMTIFGYAVSDVAGKSLQMLIPEYPRGFNQSWARLDLGRGHGYFGGKTIAVEGRHKNGTAVPLEISLGEFNEGGRHLFSAVIRDVTDRHRVEEQLRTANETLRALIESSPLAIVAVDARGLVTKWNPAAETLFGWTEADIIGKSLPFEPENAALDSLALLDAIARGRSISVERMRQTKSGGHVVVAVSAAPLRDAAGAISGAVGVVTDITERKRLEDQLRQAQKMEAVGQLAGGVAHDFNNLLTVITGYDQLLVSSLPEGERAAGYAREIMSAAERASSLTRQLLAFSRRQVTQPKVLDVSAVVSDMSKILRRLVGENIELLAALPPLSGRILADPGQVEQIVLNLVVNARDAMPDGGRLTIETADVDLREPYLRTHVSARPGPHVLLAVSDTGTGMDAETRRRVFEPFFTTKEQGKGTGLGLSTVYGIVKQHDANVWVYSEPGLGSTFKVYFPAVETTAPRTASAEAAIQPRGTETVLVLEDEDGVRSLVRELLEPLGYRVLVARTAEEANAICRAERSPIHLLLTDVVMPDGSGRETAERLSRERPDLHVLYMSGYPDETIVKHGILAPGVAFLQKPFSQEKLGAKVREVLDSRPRNPT